MTCLFGVTEPERNVLAADVRDLVHGFRALKITDKVRRGEFVCSVF